MNLLRSAFGYCVLKWFQAFVLALSGILFASSDLSHAKIFIALIMKMLVLTIIADSNYHAVRFREPLGKIKLYQTCSLYNSWYNLKSRGEISIFDWQNNASIEIIPPGKCTLESLAKALWKVLSEGKGFKVTMNDSKATMIMQTKRELNSIEIFLHSSGLISVCKRKISPADLLHSTVTLFTVIFWTRMKTYLMGNPQALLVALTLLWEPVWKSKLFSTESGVTCTKNNS